MYQKYQTDAIVVGSRESGEAEKSLALYTRDFGLVRARATSVRSEKSKMRYALQSYARANVALVRGKSGWRAAGASASTTTVDKDGTGIAAFARISELVTKLVAGEDHNEYLFDALAEAHTALMREHVESVATIEIIAVARFSLRSVIFLPKHSRRRSSRTPRMPRRIYAKRKSFKMSCLMSINKALSQTHL